MRMLKEETSTEPSSSSSTSSSPHVPAKRAKLRRHPVFHGARRRGRGRAGRWRWVCEARVVRACRLLWLATEAAGAARAHRAAVMLAADDAMSATTESGGTEATGSSPSAAAGVAAAAYTCGVVVEKEASPFEQAVVREMGWDLYYASLAEALLMEPPASGDASCCCEDGDRDDSGVPLWSY